MSIGSPSVKTVHFYSHSSKANMSNCSNSRNWMPSSRHGSQTHAMTLPMWLQLWHPQSHKLSQRTLRPAYLSRPCTTWHEAPRLPIPNHSMGIETKLKSSWELFRLWSPGRLIPSQMREWRSCMHFCSCAEAWHKSGQRTRLWQL